MNNPKTHDALFKWLITLFYREFFAHYFPSIPIGKAAFLDKEFISKYEALKESMKGDLLLLMEVTIQRKRHEILIYIEHKSRRQEVAEKLYEYGCYAWLLRKRPVWCIALYTDEALWQKPISDRFWFGFNSRGKQWASYDIIKVKGEKSAELIAQQSLFSCLLALKADDRECDRRSIVREIYRVAANMADGLSDDHKLLIDQFVNAYGKVPKREVRAIQKETGMTYVASSITEHYIHIGEERGKEIGKEKGEAIGLVKGAIANLEELRKDGLLSKEAYQQKIKPLKAKLSQLQEKNIRRA